MKFPRRKVFISLLLLCMLALLFYNTNAIGRLMYPIHFEKDIWISATNFDIDPLFIAAIIRTESKYKPGLESSKKAAGLMQIMPETAKWVIERAGYSEQMMEHIMQPAVNIELGTWYLHWLIERYSSQTSHSGELDDDLVAVIAASYNAGHNKVGEWMREGVWDGRYATRIDIPYGETRHYIKRVIYFYQKYKTFYVAESIESHALGN